jgi:hypothetical protein
MYGSVSSLAMMLARGILFKEWGEDVLREMAGVLYLLGVVLVEWETGEDILDVIRWLRNMLSEVVEVDMSEAEISAQEIEELMRKGLGRVS